MKESSFHENDICKQCETEFREKKIIKLDDNSYIYYFLLSFLYHLNETHSPSLSLSLTFPLFILNLFSCQLFFYLCRQKISSIILFSFSVIQKSRRILSVCAFVYIVFPFLRSTTYS